MKKFSIVMLLAATISLVGCGSSDEVSGRSMRTALKSVKQIKRHLPVEQQIEYEVAFWTIKSSAKDNKEFLDQIGGKKPEEVIALGRKIYQERKNAGAKEYAQYGSWEQMIAKFEQERIDQNRHNKKADAKDEANNVMYKL